MSVVRVDYALSIISQTIYVCTMNADNCGLTLGNSANISNTILPRYLHPSFEWVWRHKNRRWRPYKMQSRFKVATFSLWSSEATSTSRRSGPGLIWSFDIGLCPRRRQSWRCGWQTRVGNATIQQQYSIKEDVYRIMNSRNIRTTAAAIESGGGGSDGLTQVSESECFTRYQQWLQATRNNLRYNEQC